LRLKTISKVRELFMLMDGSTLVIHAQGTRHQIQTLKIEISDMLKFGRFQGIGGLIQINNGAYFMEGM
jgi:hypothetical protein